MRKIFFSIFCSISLLCSACFQSDKACLDISASNFDVNADETCCCIYPLLSLNIIHRVQDTIPLSFDSTYLDAMGNPYQIKNFAFYLSDFTVTKNGENLYTIDTIQLRKLVGADTLKIGFRDDISLVRRNNSPEHLIDTFPFDGTFDGISFRMGLKDSLTNIVTRSARSGSVLRPQAEALYDVNAMEYVGLWLVLARDTSDLAALDTLRFLSSELPPPFALQGFTPISKVLGSNLKINVQVNYDALMQDVDIQGDLTALKAKIIQNISGAFRTY